ncbi:MAG: alpha/beta hydrolase [Propionibacteriaceae bacterium]|nr:alpha/beta hydrolase [Propionibacteriaceae bacterium]
MPVRPSLRPLLALATALDRPQPGLSVAERREAAATGPLQMRYVTSRSSVPLEVSDRRIPVAGGEISVRIYRPRRRAAGAGRLPVHLFMHGGSFWLGSVAEYEPLCRWYAGSVGCVVVSVEYRLAPEFPYPAGVEDCYAALVWVAQTADELGVDPDRLSIGGVSAGGTLAAAIALLARDRSGPRIILQALEIPATDLTMSQPSIEEFAVGYSMTRASLIEAYGFYLPEPATAREAYASPLLAADLTDLPPAFVLTCECDPLRDEGEAYARRLRESGGAATVHRVGGHVHGSIYLTRFLPSARKAVESTCRALTTAYATARGRH